MISDDEQREREAEWERQKQERLERMARVPEDLAGYRLSRGCTCGAQAEAEKKWGTDVRYWGSMGIPHSDDCEWVRALYIQIIEIS
jgi:hypothetical protein